MFQRSIQSHELRRQCSVASHALYANTRRQREKNVTQSPTEPNEKTSLKWGGGPLASPLLPPLVFKKPQPIHPWTVSREEKLRQKNFAVTSSLQLHRHVLTRQSTDRMTTAVAVRLMFMTLLGHIVDFINLVTRPYYVRTRVISLPYDDRFSKFFHCHIRQSDNRAVKSQTLREMVVFKYRTDRRSAWAQRSLE